MWFGILGAVEVRRRGAPVAVGGPRVRTLLGALLLDAGRVVPVERLIDAVYGDDPPANAANALQAQVSRLRRGLGDAGLVEGRPAGYRLAVDPDDVDAFRFERLVEEGRGAEAARAVGLFREALGLWRGPALADVPIRADRLDEARVGVREELARALLAAGEPAEAAAEARAVLAEHPLRERAAALAMRALRAEGRQAEALAVFAEMRERLADELGADPSADLAEAHLEVLRGAPAEVVTPLPVPLTSFVGRDEEVRRVGKMLGEGRLVTLLGPGGAGKTRLAVEAAGRVGGEVCFVDLAPATADEVPKALAGALGLRLPGAGPAEVLERLLTALAGRRVLLVLDNCEHVVDAVARVAHRSLTACAELRVLATSREALGITGEALLSLPPLPMPPDGADARDAPAYPAVRLFADRAAAVRPGFRVDEGNVADVLRICGALDGLPLAIELAAARLRTLPAEDVATRLGDRFRLLSRGERTAAPRHQTLRAVVEWSWDLLGADERALARRLTVFSGGFTAEAAAAVCGADEETVFGLADKSLVQSDGRRFRMLDTIRAFCAERLEEAGERERFQRAHAEYFLELARRADPHLRGAEQLEWLDLLAGEHANLHAALRRCVRLDHVLALHLIANLTWYWWLRGRVEGATLATELLDAVGAVPDGLDEEYVLCATNAIAGGVTGDRAVAWLDRAEALLNGIDRTLAYPATTVQWALTAGPERTRLAVFPKQIPDDPWSRALLRMSDAYLHQFSGGFAAAEQACADALAGFRAAGDRWGTANTLDILAHLADRRGDRERALALLAEALALTEALGALEDTADLLFRRADIRLRDGDLDAARTDLARGGELARRAGAPDKVAAARFGAAQAARLRGDLAAARSGYAEALAGAATERFPAAGTRCLALVGLGWVAVEEGDHRRARELFREALLAGFDHPIFSHEGTAAAGLAAVALAEGDPARAAVLLGAAGAVHGALVPGDPDGERVASRVRGALGADAFEAAAAEGAALTRDEAVRLLTEPPAGRQ